MRRIYREDLALDVRLGLYRRSKRVTSTGTAQEEWKKYRASKASVPVVNTLRAMVGPRQRCVYCCDSRSADVDHYKPKATFYDLTFDWSNLIWVCPECNRMKGSRFPLDADGEPLIIDPTKINPWRHLMLDTMNGNIAPRYHKDNGYDPLGEATLDAISCINHEAVIEGRKRVIGRYRSVVELILQGQGEDTSLALRNLIREVREDLYGIGSWFVSYEGSRESDFTELRETYPELWRRLARKAG